MVKAAVHHGNVLGPNVPEQVALCWGGGAEGESVSVFTANSAGTGEPPGVRDALRLPLCPCVWIKHSLLVVRFHRLINSNSSQRQHVHMLLTLQNHRLTLIKLRSVLNQTYTAVGLHFP